MSVSNVSSVAGTQIQDATCTGCGCLCDDIDLTVENGRITRAERACELGRAWFLADHSHEGTPRATLGGAPVDLEKALDRAAHILRAARAPVLLGLTQTTTEAVADSLAIADRIGATVDWDPTEAATARILAVQRAGRVSASLGEVKNRADVVLFWGTDPVVTHPRHWERYSVEPRGRFLPDGRANRTVIVVDSQRTATAEQADLFLQVEPDAWFETLWTLRTLVRDACPDAPSNASPLDNLAQKLQAARYGAFFYGSSLGAGRGGFATVEAALRLVCDLNDRNRFVILGMGARGNAAGAESALTWQTGFPTAVNFASGSPRSLPGSTSARQRLETGQADAALIVGDSLECTGSAAALARLERIPTIIIGPRATRAVHPLAVTFDCATPGIDAPGTVTRCDGVVLPLRPPLTNTVPTDREILREIARRLDQTGKEGALT